ncbi:uncharacterized protein LOC115883405 [Sitophilus oryzae]|uniref:Uncharacterized protein LOC115883405 n=1 Tax=Sitophilus oryzae TaxID=7048 RepID=A0A6J2Y3P5_SITOR|nr:uncharacterized protein LOC115883405 [Sitophilus oryzae]
MLLISYSIQQSSGELAEKMQKYGRGRVRDDTLFTLFFLDDQIVISEDEKDLSYMIRKLQEEYEANLSKCEYLIVVNEEIKYLTLDTNTRGIKPSKYLGIIFNKTNSGNEMQERVNKGRTVARTLTSLPWNKQIKRSTKKRIYSSIVQSVTLYGSEIWDVTKANKNKLMTTEMDFQEEAADDQN